MLGILKRRLAEERSAKTRQWKEKVISRQNEVITKQREVISGQEEVISELVGVIRAELYRSFHQHHPNATKINQHGTPSTHQGRRNIQQADYSAEQKQIMQIGHEDGDAPPPPPLSEDPAGIKWDEETVQALKFIIRKTVANQAHRDSGLGQQSPNTSPRTGPEPTPTRPQSLSQQHPKEKRPNEDLCAMMQVPGSKRQFRVAA